MVMCKYYAFERAANSNFKAKILAFKEAVNSNGNV